VCMCSTNALKLLLVSSYCNPHFDSLQQHTAYCNSALFANNAALYCNTDCNTLILQHRLQHTYTATQTATHLYCNTDCNTLILQHRLQHTYTATQTATHLYCNTDCNTLILQHRLQHTIMTHFNSTLFVHRAASYCNTHCNTLQQHTATAPFLYTEPHHAATHTATRCHTLQQLFLVSSIWCLCVLCVHVYTCVYALRACVHMCIRVYVCTCE